MTSPDVLHMRVKDLMCHACGVWAPITVAGKLPDGTVVYAVTWTCEICKCNRSYAAAL